MKKFFVGLLSVFLLLGASILTACGGNSIDMTLSTSTVSIQIKDESVTPEQIVVATVTGTDDSSISASAFGYEEIIDVRTEQSTDGRTLIYITGKDTEGYAEVLVRTHQGNATSVITVDVYSEVSDMEQKVEESAKKNNFAIRGGSVELVEENLITFLPSENSRRTITWTLLDTSLPASIEGNALSIEPSFSQDSITLVAATEKGVTCNVTLPVIDKLEQDLTMSWSYNRDNQAYELITEGNNTFNIVPNLATDEEYTGYIKLNFSQDLEIGYTVVTADGQVSDDLIINAVGEDNDGNPIYEVFANKNDTNINEDFIIYFTIGYQDYNYSISTLETLPINISVREKVNGVIISGDTIDNIAGTTQVLYSEYLNGHGQAYNVQITPTTVVDATRQYSIGLRITNPSIPSGGLSSGCPVEFWYRDANNNNIWTQAVMEYDSSQDRYITRDNNMLTASTIYMKAASDIKVQNFEGIEITFTSADNPDITNVFYAELVKSVSQDDFIFEDADFRVDSSSSTMDVSITKTFTLQGQTTTDGLYVVLNSENVQMTQPVYISSTADSITFSITLTLNRSSFGVTSLDSYQICHENGLESDVFDIDIFLPLKDAAIIYDTGNASNSVTNVKTDNISYDSNGNELISSMNSISSIMLKNATTSPVLYMYNTSGSYSAVASVSVSYYDFVESDTMTAELFRKLITSPAGVLSIINAARTNTDKTSSVAHFSADNNNIITSGVGLTYAVVTFTGKAADDNADINGNTSIIKIILIESYVSPDGLSINPLSDRNVNLYAADTVATRDEGTTRKTITISFANAGITYASLENFDFVSTIKDASGNPVMSHKVVSGNSVSWTNGRYSIENIVTTDSYITFDIVTISNFGSYSFYDELELHYQLNIVDGEGNKQTIDMMWTTINITIKNAQRLTEITWENSDEDGIYFEIGDREPYYIVLSTSPSNARNSNVSYLITDENGGVIDDNSFIGVDNQVSSNMLGLSLSERITQGMIGYIYILPEDAVYNGNIIYNYLDSEGQSQQSQISVRALGLIREGSQTWFDYLTAEAFFLTNNSIEDQATTVYFKDILLKIKITVADGSSFEYAYRIYDEDGFINLKPDLYYTVMNSLEIPESANRQAIAQFNGGLQGYNETTTISLNGANFAYTIGSTAEIRNIIFSGSVTGLGFIANENNGKLNNVTIDVYQTYSSLLSSTGTGYVGGLVGSNYGLITDSSVLGLTIDALSSTVGGIAGQNGGTISNSRVEFYNLTDRSNNDNTTYSTFTGYNVGGIVGQANEGSVIDHSYVYNYNIDTFKTTYTSVIQGNGAKGAIVGILSGESTIYYSFAVIDNVANYYGNVDGTIGGSASASSDFYISYFTQESYTSVYYYNGTLYYNNDSPSSNLVSSGENFHSYVNGGNKHYRDLYQEEKVTDVSSNSVQTFIDNGYYKSLQVGSNGSSYGIIFNYEIVAGANDLTSTEENDLNALNTIALADLVGRQVTDNIIITSSNTAIIKVIGSSLSIVGTGDVTLTISSKHDVKNNKVISIKVLPSFSQMIISYVDSANNTYQVQDGSTTYLQKTKTRDYIFTYENTTVILGSGGQRYQLVQNDINLTSEFTNLGSNTGITIEKVSNSIYKITANNVEDGSAQVVFKPIVTDDNTYQDAINEEFAKSFTIIPVDGVISFEYTGDSLPLTPSTNAAIRVELNTTAESDRYGLIPSISYNGDKLQVVRDENLSQENEVRVYNVYNYLLPKDYGTDNYSLNATVSLSSSSYDEMTGIYSYVFNISFSIHANYKTQVDEDMTFNVSFVSGSGTDSTQGGSAGSVELKLTRQKFTSVDVTNYTIDRSIWTQSSGVYVTQHTKGEQASVVSPGSSSIMQISVNPSFAYYDYMTLSYSGATVSNAVSFELLRSNSSDNTTFIPSTDSDYYNQGDLIRFVPTAEEKEIGAIYIRVSISSTVNSDSTLKFTASFYQSEGNLLTSVNYYMSISYLSEPTISVDGSSTAYIALGSTAEIEIQVREDQVVESAVLDGEGIHGIYISSLTEHEADPITGIKTYTATLSANINASVAAENNAFYIQAQVSRTLNGVKEIKTTQATVVLVDFKIDKNNIEIDNAEDGVLDVWYGVRKTFDVTYNLLPETYNYDASDSDSTKKVQELIQARANFQKYQYYASYTDESLDYYSYAINYDASGNPMQIQQRLFYVVDGDEIPVTSDDYDAAVKFEFVNNGDAQGNKYSVDSQNVLITGTKMGATETILLKTYISLGDNSEPTIYNTYFTINVKTYSDPDLPVTISNATEFKNLNPNNYDNSTSISAEDYILMNDIVLENYTPFTTSLISSLDGNGYTIYIKSFDMSSLSGSTVNLALFDTISSATTLKNVRINVYNGGQITINLAQLSSNVRINVAGLAVTNHGTITNCEVVSYYTDQAAMGDVVNVSATTAHNNPSGINVQFIRGANTTENVYVTQNSTWTPQIAGFVIDNDGSITNSRVGGESITILGSEQMLNGKATGYTYASTLALDTFYIVGQGDMAGFVLANTGTIAASFVKLLDMENQSNTTIYDTTGFVGTNSGKIITSYIEGVPTDESLIEDSSKSYSAYAFEGSSLKSRLGVIAGFVNNNLGTIQNSYSNILIANSTDTVRVYFASGFVYENSGTIEACYSASQIANSRSTQMNFSGVDENGDLLALGSYTNCYFFNKRYSGETSDDGTVESQYGTGAILIPNPTMSSYFYGFAVADGENDGVWRITEEGVTLIEPNLQSHSHRYAYYLDKDSGYEGATGENEQGQYIFRYAILQFTDSSREVDTALGSTNNPILITNAQDFIEVMGNSSSTPISQNYNSSVVWGSYRMVADVDLSSVSESIILPSTTKAFAGRLYGNGFTISYISIASETRDVSYGLFASVESRNGSVPLISNLNLEINQVVAGSSVMVGGLAGYIKDSIIVNIEIDFSEDAKVTGLNFVGGLTGFSFGSSVIKNIVVTDPYVIADRYSQASQDAYFNIPILNDVRNDISNSLNYNTTINSSVISQLSDYSYAGSVVGFVDNFTTATRTFNINQAEDYSINNIRVSGIVYVQGQVAGGIFGLTGFQTNIRDAGINITGTSSQNESHIIATKYFAGGVVGQSFGALSRVYSSYDDATQDIIEDSLQAFYSGNTAAERGALDIFYLTGSSYSQLYIGGIAGYVGSGKLEISYSKLNVTSSTADFAGGVIGGINLTNASSYQVVTDVFTEGTFTKYFINEVYASGDVRARQDGNKDIMTAGGIIGASIGTGNRISLLAVNAVNEIANYDYQTGQYLSETNAGNISFSYKTNLILGSAFDEQDDVEKNNAVDLTINNYSSYLSIIQLTTADEGGTTLGVIPTVAYYDSYSFNGFRKEMYLFGDVDGSISSNEDALVYQIASPTNFTDSAVGHTYTQQAFLSSGAWDTTHWVHETEDLFPSIRYQRTTNYVYLDAYEESIISVFERLQDANSDLTVVVRGRTSADNDDSFSDIDLSSLLARGIIQPISGYSGTIIGSEEYIVTSGDRQGERVRIVSSESFIDSTGAGFYMDNVHIAYVGTTGEGESQTTVKVDTNSNNNSGLFSVGGISEATLSNLNIEINSPVTSTINDALPEEYNFGLIAPIIRSSILSNITITSSVSSGSSLINISVPSSSTSNTVDASIGMLAGTLDQNSTIAILRVEGIEYNFNGDLISLSSPKGGSLENVNLGGYFGKTTRSDDALDAKLTINNIIKSGDSSSTSELYQAINVTSGLTIKNLNVGGIIGQNGGVNNITNFGGSSIAVELDIRIGAGVTISNDLYAGLVFGQSSATIDTVNLNNSNMSGGLYVQQGNAGEAVITNLYAGGFAGAMLNNSTTLRNVDTLNFEIESYVNQGDLLTTSDDFDENEFISYYDDRSQYEKRMLSVNGNANIGIIVGFTNARFSFSGGSSIFSKLNDNGEYIRIKAPKDKELNVGSVIGKFAAVSAVGNNTANTLTITSNITSNAAIIVSQYDSNSDNVYDVNVGGIIGTINSSSSTSESTEAVASKSVIGDETQNTINFLGTVYSNVNSINFGGIVGLVNFYSANDSIVVQNGVFGGAFRIYGSSSNEIVAGGTIGALLSQGTINVDDNSSPNVTLSHNYNYGDVFVEYENYNSENSSATILKSLARYTFGGLVGEISAGNNGTNPFKLDADSNYSLVTSHNARYIETDTSENNALFGTRPSENSNITNNFYSSSVTLAVDDLGIDVGYYSAYLADSYGFNSDKNASLNSVSGSSINIVNVISSYNIYEKNLLEQGHKLSPISLSDNSEISEATQFNGMTYYIFDTNSGAFTSQLNLVDFETEDTESETKDLTSDLKNVAIIGDGREITYRLDSNNSSDHKSFIDTLSGYSYVSGLVINLDISTENDDGDDKLESEQTVFSGLVNTMQDNTTIFAVQAKGEMSVGGVKAVNVAGLVGNVKSGKIIYATTSLDITYRAGGNGNVYGLAGFTDTDDTTNKFILYSYTAGSISSYIDANLYAVTAGAAHTTIDNTYSIVKMTLDDYTTVSTPNGKVAVFSDGTELSTYSVKNSYYDYNALDVELFNSYDSENNKTTTENGDDMRKDTSFFSNAVPSSSSSEEDGSSSAKENSSSLSAAYFDKGHYDFNYGYPTTKFGFMKVSSFATASELQPDGEKGTYDYHVASREYTRLPNNTSPSTIDPDASAEDAYNGTYYYIIPNVGVLQKMGSIDTKGYNEEETSKVGHFVLWYSIDLAYTQYASWQSLKTTIKENDTESVYLVEFDGNDNTITNIDGAPFFDNIGYKDGESISIRNLRLTDATVLGTGVLARTIYNADISNMTISGSTNTSVDGVLGLKEGDDPNEATYNVLGGLANEAYNSTISTVTNLVTIDVTDKTKTTLEVGGLVGRMENTKINYSSNYGPINVYCKGDSEKSTGNYYVGGLVGNIVGSSNEISYSYNATSVMANYASSTELSSTLGDYYVGGLAGYSNATDLIITGSYNSGAIKSGNKSNGASSGSSIVGRSYAAGIIATAANAKIRDCYNEGSIEALGASPTTEYEWNGDNLELKQTSNRNVWAYAIAYLDAGLMEDCLARDATETSIYMNGSMLDSDTVITSWNYSRISSKISITGLNNYNLGWWFIWWGQDFAWSHRFIGGSTIGIKSELAKPSENQSLYDSDYNVHINSYSSFGLPNSFVVPIYVKSTITVYISQFEWGWWWGGKDIEVGYDDFDWQNGTKQISDIYNLEYAAFNQNDKLDLYQSYIETYKIQDSFVGVYGGNYLDNKSSAGQSVVDNTRSLKSFSDDEIVHTISGEEYYFVAENNMDGVFNTNVYQYNFTIELTDIPVMNNLSYYTVEATSDGKRLTTNKNSIDGNNLSVTCFSFEKLNSPIVYEVTFNYSKTLNLNTTDLEYYYVDNSSIGLRIGGIENDIQCITGYTLKSPNGVEYDNVLKAYLAEEGEEELPDVIDNENSTEKDFIYLAVDENGMLIYIPNASLKMQDKSIVVNEETLSGGTLNGDFANNVNTIINNRFNGKSYYLSTVSGQTGTREIDSFSNISGSGSADIPGDGGTASSDATIKYGEEQDWYGDISYIVSQQEYSSTITLEVENTFNIANQGYENDSYKVTLSGADFATYSPRGWSFTNSSGSIAVGGQSYSYTLALKDSNTLKFTFNTTLNSSAATSLASSLKSYISENLKVSATQTITDNKNITDEASAYIDISGDTTIDITNIFELAGQSYENDSYTIMLGGQEFATYSLTDGWTLNDENATGSITIDETIYQFTASIANNAIKLSFGDIVITDVAASIREYLNNNISVNATQIITDINYIQDADISNYASISSGSSTTPTNAAHSFTVNLKTFNEDVLVINGNTVILGYSNNQGWIKASTYRKQNIGGYLFEIELENGKLVFTYQAKNDNLGLNANSLASILSGYLAISNNFDAKVDLIDQFAGNVGGEDIDIDLYDNNDNLIGHVDASTAVDKKYALLSNNNYYLTLSDNTVRFNPNIENMSLTSLKKYTLGEITVYYGEYKFEFEETCTTKITTQYLTLDEDILNIGDAFVIERTVQSKSSSRVFCFAQTADVIENEGEYSIGLGAISGITEDSTFTINICPAYRLKIDETNNVNVLLQDNNNDYYMIDATINDDFNEVSINSVSYFIKDQYSPEIILTYNEEDPEQFIIRDSNNNTILTRILLSTGEYVYKLIYKYNGQYDQGSDGSEEIGEQYGVVSKYSELPDLIYTSLTNISNNHRSIKLDDILNSFGMPKVSYEDYKNYLFAYSSGNSRYIYVNNKYTVQHGYKVDLNGEEVTLRSTISTMEYTWTDNAIATPIYTSVSSSFDIPSDYMPKFDILFDYSFEGDGESAFSANRHYIKNGNTYTVILNNNSTKVTEFSVTATAGSNSVQSNSIIVVANEPMKAYSIVLMNDISIRNNPGFSKAENVNIIGNGYYISYYVSSEESSLFIDLSSSKNSTSYIINLMLLGENYNGALVFSGYNYNSYLNNISIYGSASNIDQDIGTILNVNGDVANDIENSNIKNYASITSSLNSQYDLTLFNNNIEVSLVNYGLITAANGNDGKSASNISRYNYSKDGNDAGENGNGKNGHNIIISQSSAAALDNYGIIKAGNGGNGGAGGSSGRARDSLTSISKQSDPGEEGEGGNKGLAGNIYIFKSNDNTEKKYDKNLALDGVVGLAGARGRYSLGGISYITNSISETTEGRTPDYLKVRQISGDVKTIQCVYWKFDKRMFNTLDGVVNSSGQINFETIFHLTNDYATQFPKDDQGRIWTGNDYDRLLGEANKINN